MDSVDAINEAVALHRGWLEEARQKGDGSTTVQRWTRRMLALQAAAEELKALRALHAPIRGDAPELDDLPPAVRGELAGRKPDLLEERIVILVEAAGAEGLGLDRMLVELWRRFGEAETRKALNNKCYRMVAKGLIEPVEGLRGTYGPVGAPSLSSKPNPADAG